MGDFAGGRPTSYVPTGCDYTPSIQHAHDIFVYGDIRGIRVTNFAQLSHITGVNADTLRKYARRDNWPFKAHELALNGNHLPAGTVHALAKQPAYLARLELKLKEIEEEFDKTDLLVTVQENIGSAKEPIIIETEIVNPKYEKLLSLMNSTFDKIQKVSGAYGVNEAQSKRLQKMATVKGDLEAKDAHEKERRERIRAANVKSVDGVKLA